MPHGQGDSSGGWVLQVWEPQHAEGPECRPPLVSCQSGVHGDGDTVSSIYTPSLPLALASAFSAKSQHRGRRGQLFAPPTLLFSGKSCSSKAGAQSAAPQQTYSSHWVGARAVGTGALSWEERRP